MKEEKFTLMSEDEPTDEQLHMIMKDALQDVMESKKILKEKYDTMMKEALIKAEKWNSVEK